MSGSNYIKILSVLLWSWFIISSIILTPLLVLIWCLTFFFDPRLVILHRFSCFWGAQYIWMNPLWKLTIEGRRKISNEKASIIISNHQSLADILIIYSTFRHFRWTSKAENFRIPFVGWVLFFNRSVKIYRNSPEAFASFRKRAMQSLRQGTSLVMFPEGTRSRNGELGKFKEGAFRLAHEAKCDIIPLVLDGSAAAIPKKGWVLTGRQRMTLKVLDPVPYNAYKELTPMETAKFFRGIVLQHMAG